MQESGSSGRPCAVPQSQRFYQPEHGVEASRSPHSPNEGAGSADRRHVALEADLVALALLLQMLRRS